jgi:hypothetical protein
VFEQEGAFFRERSFDPPQLSPCAILQLSFPQRSGGAGMRWSSEDKLGCTVVCIVGAVVGLFVGFVVFAISVARGTGDVFAHWIARPSLYWPWPAFGVAIAGLTFWAFRILRGPRHSTDDGAGAESRADAYYALISGQSRDCRSMTAWRGRTSMIGLDQLCPIKPLRESWRANSIRSKRPSGNLRGARRTR